MAPIIFDVCYRIPNLLLLTLTCTTVRLTLQYVQLGHTICSDCDTLLGLSLRIEARPALVTCC